MSLTKHWNKKIKTLDWVDIALLKLSVAFFVLMVAKLWPVLVRLDWHWYALLFVVTAIKPLYKTYVV